MVLGLDLLLIVLLFFPALPLDLHVFDRVHLLELLFRANKTGNPEKQPLCCLKTIRKYLADQKPKVCKPKLPNMHLPQLEDEVEQKVDEFNKLFDMRKDMKNPMIRTAAQK